MSGINKPVKLEVHSETLEKALNELAEEMLEVEAVDAILEQGRDLRWGMLSSFGLLEAVSPDLVTNEGAGVDIFGQVLSKKPTFECECPKCNRMLAAARFAPHLEKCMGMGRNSSRIASRRLAASSSSSNTGSAGSSDAMTSKGSNSANNGTVPSTAQICGDIPSEDEHFEEDLDDDEDWTMDRKKKPSKKGSDKTTPKRKGPVSRVKNIEGRGRRGASPSVSITSSPASSIVDAGTEDSVDPLSLS